jgi:hypothetical protein
MADNGQIEITSLDRANDPAPDIKKLFLYLTFTTDRESSALSVAYQVSKDGKGFVNKGPMQRVKPVNYKAPPNVTLWRVPTNAYRQYRVTVSAKTKATLEEVWTEVSEGTDVVRDKNSGEFKQALADQAGPNIVVAINELAVGPMPAAGDSEPATIAAIIAHVEKRLIGVDARKDFDKIWTTENGVRKDSNLNAKAVEERWAQLVSERLAYSPYAGPAISYDRHILDEHEFYRKMLDDGDPAYPLVGACQHIALFLAVSRGFDTHYEADAPTTETALKTGAPTLKVPPVNGAKWFPSEDATGGYPPLQKYLLEKNFKEDLPAHTTLHERKVTPGSCFVSGLGHLFGEYDLLCPIPTSTTGQPGEVEAPMTAPAYIENNKKLLRLRYNAAIAGATNYPAAGKSEPATGVPLYKIGRGFLAGQHEKTSEAHVAAVLRVDDVGGRIQVFDTGGGLGRMDFGRVVPSLAPLGSTSVTQESLWARAEKPFHMAGYSGMGVLPAPPGDQLEKAVARLEKMRPLGLCQLVVVRRTETPWNPYTIGNILWSSKLLPMWRHDGSKLVPFPMTTLLWSLRGHPAWDKFEVRWIVYLPRRGLCGHLWLDNKISVEKAVERTIKGVNNKHGKPIWPLARDRNLPVDMVMPVGEFGSLPDGNAAMTARGADRKSGKPIHLMTVYRLPWANEGGSTVLPPNTTLTFLRDKAPTS